jgi:hypothetical protein
VVNTKKYLPRSLITGAMWSKNLGLIGNVQWPFGPSGGYNWFISITSLTISIKRMSSIFMLINIYQLTIMPVRG